MSRKPSRWWIVVVVVVVLLLASGAWLAWGGGEQADKQAQNPPAGESPVADAGLSDGTPTDETTTPTPTERTMLREPVPVSTADADPGSLRVELSYPNGDPGVDLAVEVAPQDLTFDEASSRRLEFRSDETGVVVCEGLASGEYSVSVIHPIDVGKTATVRPGEETVLPIRFRPGCVVAGVVVDRNGRHVTGASIWTLSGGHGQRAVARSDDRGRFVLREAGRYLELGATRAGYAPSAKQTVRGQPGQKLSVRLVLQGAGGAVRGMVVQPNGEPLSGAVIVFPNTGLPWTFWGEERLLGSVQAVRVKTDRRDVFSLPGCHH